MWRLLVVCLFWLTFLLTANFDDERELFLALGRTEANVVASIHADGNASSMLATARDRWADLNRGQGAQEQSSLPSQQYAQGSTPIVDVQSDRSATMGAPFGSGEASPSALVSKLQGELRRVGCYEGGAPGAWDLATRRAMAAFDERIGARLPVEKAEPKFLTLVASYGNRACGQPCPIGQVPEVDGKCAVPASSLAGPLPQESPTEALSITPTAATNDWTTMVVPSNEGAPSTTPMSPMPVVPSAIEAPQTTIAVLPYDRSTLRIRKSSGWGSTGFGIGLRSGASVRWSSGEPDDLTSRLHHIGSEDRFPKSLRDDVGLEGLRY
jgi:hypothetical protein